MSQQTSNSSSTISSLIQEIQINILKNKCETQEPSEELNRYHKKWSHEEKKILAYLVQEYGTDFTYFKRFLPFKTRRQIQRGYEAQALKQLKLHKVLQRKERKDHFDIDVLSDDGPLRPQIKN